MLGKTKEIIDAAKRYEKRRQDVLDAAKKFKEEQGYNPIANWTDQLLSEFVVFSLGVTGPKDFPVYKLEMFVMASKYFGIEIEGGKMDNDKNIRTAPARSSAKRGKGQWAKAFRSRK